MILHKTELAIAELNATKRSLSVLERRILLFTDGVRNIDQIRALVNTSNSGELLYLLEKQGFLSQAKPKQQALSAPSVSVVDELKTHIKPFITPIATNSVLSKFMNPATHSNANKVSNTSNVSEISAQPIQAATINTVPNLVPPVETQTRGEQPAPTQEYNVDEQTKLAIKRIITDTCSEHLGIFSRELLDKTQQAQDAKQLRACISQWHMAMQESKTGREHCFVWLNEVNELLIHGTAQELKSA